MMTDKQIITKENVKDVLLKAKEELWYMAIDCSTGNPIDLREIYNVHTDDQRKNLGRKMYISFAKRVAELLENSNDR